MKSSLINIPHLNIEWALWLWKKYLMRYKKKKLKGTWLSLIKKKNWGEKYGVHAQQILAQIWKYSGLPFKVSEQWNIVRGSGCAINEKRLSHKTFGKTMENLATHPYFRNVIKEPIVMKLC